VLEQTLQGKQTTVGPFGDFRFAELPYGKTCDVKTPDSMNAAAEEYYTILVERQRYDTLKAASCSINRPASPKFAKKNAKTFWLKNRRVIRMKSINAMGETDYHEFCISYQKGMNLPR
jgi:hypothetical protein